VVARANRKLRLVQLKYTRWAPEQEHILGKDMVGYSSLLVSYRC